MPLPVLLSATIFLQCLVFCKKAATFFVSERNLVFNRSGANWIQNTSEEENLKFHISDAF